MKAALDVCPRAEAQHRRGSIASALLFVLVLIRDLLVTILLSCLITVGLLHCIWLYLTLFLPLPLPTANCVIPMQPETIANGSYLTHLRIIFPLDLYLTPLQRAVASLTYTDVLRVTTGFTFLVFALVELVAIHARTRTRDQDAERGHLGGFGSEKHTHTSSSTRITTLR
ncbi:hypothetical protein C8F01DRAFT_1245794 [Mycena amicta]|nr:hypothetical protein C8F01DRAFT_1245794 [Mycena amicta]